MSLQLTADEVSAAAHRIVDAYAAMDVDTYFASFDAEATFIFHGSPERLSNREQYEKEWRTWVSEGWAVISCHSSDAFIQIFGSTAVFSHSVETVTEEHGQRGTAQERETIVFTRKESGSLVAVHEHLSLNTY